MRDFIITALIFGAVPVVFFRPFMGLLVWCWISYMVPHKLAWGFIRDFPVAQIIALTFLTSYVFSKEPKKFPINAVTVFLFLYVVWTCITTMTAFDVDASYEMLTKLLKIMLITFVLIAMVKTKERLNLVTWVTALSIAFYGVKGGIFTILNGGTNRVWGPPGGFFEGNNEVGLAMLMIVPLLYYLKTTCQTVWARRTMFGVIALTVLAALGTHSRGAFLTAGAITLFLVLKMRGAKKFITLASFVILMPMALSFMPDHWHDRMASIFVEKEELDTSATGRINAWWMNFNLAKDNVLGGGFSASANPEIFARYAPDPLDFHDSHSIYFQTLGQHGFIGLAIYLILAAFTWLMASGIIKRTVDKPHMKWAAEMAAMLQVSGLAFFTGGMFLGLANFNLYFHLIATVVILREVVMIELSNVTNPLASTITDEPSDSRKEKPRFAPMPGCSVPKNG